MAPLVQSHYVLGAMLPSQRPVAGHTVPISEREARPTGPRQHADPAHGAPNVHATNCQMNRLQTEIPAPGAPHLEAACRRQQAARVLCRGQTTKQPPEKASTSPPASEVGPSTHTTPSDPESRGPAV